MKTRILTIAYLLFVPVMTFSQYWDNSSMTDRTLALINPAYASFNNDVEIGFNALRIGESNRYPYSLNGITSYKFDKIKSALGITYNHFDEISSKSNNVKLNYNFQPVSNDKHKLSIGLSAAYSQMRVDAPEFIHHLQSFRYGFIYFPPTDYELDAYESEAVYFGAGIMYAFKNLQTGVSFHQDMYPTYLGQYWDGSTTRDLNVYLNYKFKISGGVEMNPWLNIHNYDALNLTETLTALHFVLHKKFVIGPQINWNTEQIQAANFLLSYTAAEKWTLSCNYGVNVSRFTNQNSSRFEVGLFYSVRESKKNNPSEKSQN